MRTKIKVAHLLIPKHTTKILESKLHDSDTETDISLKDQNKEPQVNSWTHGQMKFTKVLRQQDRQRVASLIISVTKR